MHELHQKMGNTEFFLKNFRQNAGKILNLFTAINLLNVFTETIVLNVILISEGQYKTR